MTEIRIPERYIKPIESQFSTAANLKRVKPIEPQFDSSEWFKHNFLSGWPPETEEEFNKRSRSDADQDLSLKKRCVTDNRKLVDIFV